MTAAAFWFAVAAIIIAGGYFRSRSEAIKHETVRRIVEKTGQLDESQLKALFQPPPSPWPASPWTHPIQSKPGGGYRGMRVFGTLIMAVAIGLTVFFVVLSRSPHGGNVEEGFIGLGVAALVFIIGAGLFFCSNFMPKPTKD